jgi:hypothetical protein
MPCAPTALRELLAGVVADAQVGVAQPSGTSVVWDETPLPLSILVRN